MNQNNPLNLYNEKKSDETPPRRWTATKIKHVRRRLIKTIQGYEGLPEEKMLNRDQVASFKALVYAYNTLASCVKDAALDDIEARLDALEGKKNDL